MSTNYQGMAEQEKQDLFVANCVCCTLGSAMKDCKNCAFKVGLEVREVHLKTMAISDPVEKEEYWATVQAHVWDAWCHYVNKWEAVSDIITGYVPFA